MRSDAGYAVTCSEMEEGTALKGGVMMNLNEQMLPGLFLLLAGAVLGFGAGKLCRKKQNVPQMKTLGMLLCVVGAVLVFIG